MSLAALLLTAALQQPTPVDLPSSGLTMPRHMAVIDFDGTGGRLIGLYGRRFRLLGVEESPELVLPGDSTLWTVAATQQGGQEELLVVVEGDSLHRVDLVEGVLQLSEPLVSDLRCVPPRGIHPAELIQDLDSDGNPDLLLPAGDRLRVWFGDGEGFVKGPDLGAVSRLIMETGSGDLFERVIRVVEVPRLVPRDINADGRPDLVVSDGMKIHQYVVTGDEFPSTPSRTLDLADYRTADSFELDLTNVSKAVRWIVNDEWADLDGDGALDVVVLADGMVRIFMGSAEGIVTGKGQEKQVFKIGGNLIYALPANIDDDEIPDIVLVRIEDVGIGKLLRMALWSWSLQFDFLVFKGRGDGRFDKRPMAQHAVTLEGDSLMELATGDQRERLREMRKRVVRTGDLDGDGLATDLAVLEPTGRLQIWRGALSDKPSVDSLLGEFLREALGGSSEVDLDVSALEEWLLGRTSAVAAAAQGKKPDISLQLDGDWEPPHALILRDLDGKPGDEVIIIRSLPPEEQGERRRMHAISISTDS